MNTTDLLKYRLIQQGIITSGKRTPLEVLEQMGAIQGQDYSGSLWSIGLRTGMTQREIIESIEHHDIVRTWPQRGTLHFVPAVDSKWMVGLSAERLLKGAVTRHVRLGLTDAMFLKSKEVLTVALKKEHLLSRPKIFELLERHGISPMGGRGYHILWYLSQTGVLVIGEMEHKQPTYGLLDELLPNARVLSRPESITLLTKRYFTSHGPATLQDFMWWSGLTSKDARFGLAENASFLRSEKIGTKEYWLSKDAVLNEDISRNAYLLPGFDEYLLGYKDRSAIVEATHMPKIVPGNNGMFMSTIVVDGRVIGLWKRVIKKDRVVVTLDPFQKLTTTEKKLIDVSAAQYGRFLELPVEVHAAL